MRLLQLSHFAQQNALRRAVPGAVVWAVGQPPEGCSHVGGMEPAGLGKAPSMTPAMALAQGQSAALIYASAAREG